MNKSRLINLFLILTSLIGYLEWGKGQHTFLFQTEWDIMRGMFRSPDSYIHPFIIIPFLGQLLLLISIFQKQPGRLITYLGIGCIGVLLLLMLFIGILGQNFKIALSVLPFLLLAAYRIIYRKKFDRVR